ncbi:hypothetical protein HAZT_HAZT000727 [Hyalella azteca]|uniref:Armadillo-like helical domain-containing protein n=1 Tax=Hyalella azteca TaxID=294128 RepID=A0A6A0GRU0_HYAAZ|nr:hypothetical protein HAZT_HAZT000727 [Hyalella azteca]
MSSMSSKLKGGGVRRGQLKEKVVQMYEELLHPAIHPSFSPSMGTPSLPNKSPASRFWEDFFLLRTLCGLIRGVYRKCEGGGPTAVLPGSSPFSMSGSACDVINILVGFDAAEDLMRQLLLQVSEFLTADSCSRHLYGGDAVMFILLMVQYRSHEMVNPYTVQLSLLDNELVLNGYGQVIRCWLSAFNRKFAATMVEAQSSGWLASITSMVGGLFVSDEHTNRTHQIKANDAYLLGLFEAVHLNRNFITALTTAATEASSPPSPSTSTQSLHSAPQNVVRNPVCLKYEVRLLLLTPLLFGFYNCRETETVPLQIYLAETGTQGMTSSTHSSTSEAPIDSPSSPTTNTSVPCPNTAAISPSEGLSQQAAPQLITINNNTFNTSLAHDRQEENSSYEQQQLQLLLEANVQPTNLMVTFLEYCSIVMQDTKSEECHQNVQLCFIILTCISEDQYSNLLLHDANLVFAVQLHRLPMRHRKLASPHGTTNRARPLACAVIGGHYGHDLSIHVFPRTDLLVEFTMSQHVLLPADLLVEFTMSHMLKKLPVEQFMQCVGIVHRLLCYQKRNAVRLPYAWKELWTALIALTKFIVANETQLVKRHNIFQLAYQIVNIFNLFITYGDTFLSSASCYDELYYEIMRMHIVFENLYSLGLRYARSDGDYKDQAHQLTNSLANIRWVTDMKDSFLSVLYSVNLSPE